MIHIINVFKVWLAEFISPIVPRYRAGGSHSSIPANDIKASPIHEAADNLYAMDVDSIIEANIMWKIKKITNGLAIPPDK